MGTKKHVSIKNFGPINQTEIDVCPLTIFIGKNATGKSFASRLIHCLSKPCIPRFPLHSLNYTGQHDSSFNEFECMLNEHIESLPSSGTFEYPISKFIALVNEGFGSFYASSIEEEMQSNWKSCLNDLNRNKKYPFEIKCNDIAFINDCGKLICKDFPDKMTDMIESMDSTNHLDIEISADSKSLLIDMGKLMWPSIYKNGISLAKIIYMHFLSKLAEELPFTSYYIPDGEVILNDFNNHFSNEILEFIDATQKGDFYDLACEFEKEMLNGEIRIRSNGFMDEFVFVDAKDYLEFGLNLAASSVRELAPLIAYLKFHLKKGDTLIIEEIEKHLHPESQLVLVKYLVRAVNQGLNMILTTHSDFVIEKFDNFVRLGNCRSEFLDKSGYDEDCILDYNDVAIYDFKKNDGGCVAEGLDINLTGFSEESFSPVHDELYDESCDIIDAGIE